MYHHDASMFELHTDELERLIAAAHSPRDRLIICLMAMAGLRRKEVAFLRWEDIDLAGRWLNLKRTKGDKPRRVPISAELGLMLEGYRRFSRSEWLFPSRNKKGFPVTRVTVWQAVVTAERGAGLSTPNPSMKHLGCHLLRHTFARRMRKEGLRIETLARILGHDDPGLTMQLYSSPGQDEIHDEFLKVKERSFTPVMDTTSYIR
jgi:integrase